MRQGGEGHSGLTETAENQDRELFTTRWHEYLEFSSQSTKPEACRRRSISLDWQGVLLMFEHWAETESAHPPGADLCTQVSAVVIDHRVPGYVGDEFRIWMNTAICARIDESDNSIQLVELRASERFRVKSDRFRERFDGDMPIPAILFWMACVGHPRVHQ